jgi:hypothetical protein
LYGPEATFAESFNVGFWQISLKNSSVVAVSCR